MNAKRTERYPERYPERPNEYEKRAALEAFLIMKAQELIDKRGAPTPEVMAQWVERYMTEKTLMAQAERVARRLAQEAEFPY